MRNGKFKKYIFLLAVITVVNLIASRAVNAANGWEENLKLVTASSSSQTTSSVSLSLSSGTIQTNLDAANASTNPDEAGKVLSQTATITVGNTDGYTVYVSGNTNLTGKNNTSHKIPSITSSKTLGSMSNEWGYYGVLSNSEASYNPSTSFKAMTTSQQSVGTGGATSSNVTKKLTLFYGARVTSSAAEDFYGNTVTLSVVAQPRTVTTPITTMQAFDKTACGKLNTHETLQLTDTRDNKKYWVTKLLDGNCWMSQNLDFNISTSNVTTATSDVTSNWTSSSTYPARATATSVTTGSTSNTGTYSWDLGNYVIINPTATKACDSNNTGLGACSGQFIAIGSRTASVDPNFYKNSGNKTYTDTEYDAHYLAGNYYQWNAVTAGTGGQITNTNATGSICPKNWKLPSSGNTVALRDKGSFYYLLQQYGVRSSVSGTSSVNQNTYNITLSPLFFVRSGGIDSGTYPFNYAGQWGYYWSSRANSSSTTFYLYFYNSGVDPSGSASRYPGYPLRCLLPTT